MSQNDVLTSPTWKKPDEVMRLHRLRRKKRALQERMSQPSQSCPDLSKVFGNAGKSLDFSRLLGGEKRKNPFSKSANQPGAKQFCHNGDVNDSLNESNDTTLMQLLDMSNKVKETERGPAVMPTSFSNILNNFTNVPGSSNQCIEAPEGSKHIPIDWSLKTRMRLMSPKPFSWNQKLKASEAASGITGFVRCLDTLNSSTLDTSHHARFHQHCLYWQHPSLPWLSLFPRNIRVSKNNFISTNDEIKDALHRDWAESFRSLFQLVRTRQCPYFYVCANTFTCLFRAAGIGGNVETCAFITPTTRGFRQTLKQQEIEFTMPLKKKSPKKNRKNSSTDSCYDTMDDTNTASAANEENPDDLNAKDDSDDDLESTEWLEKMGIAADEIKKINGLQLTTDRRNEGTIDNSIESLVCIEGCDVQALFNFMLNCKSCITATGIFGGIPPTLLSPVAFQGGTLQSLKVRESLLHSDGGKYYSIELKGPILPAMVHSICSLLQSDSNPFSATFANIPQTVAFSKAANVCSNDGKSKENSTAVPSVFGRENLSDCGMNPELLERFCSSDPSTIEVLDSFKYCSEKMVYICS